MEIYSKEINKFENPVVWNLDPSKFKDLLLPTSFNLALVKLTFFKIRLLNSSSLSVFSKSK